MYPWRFANGSRRLHSLPELRSNRNELRTNGYCRIPPLAQNRIQVLHAVCKSSDDERSTRAGGSLWLKLIARTAATHFRNYIQYQDAKLWLDGMPIARMRKDKVIHQRISQNESRK